MNKRHMRGFLDPISLGFILALAGTATALTIHEPKTSLDDRVQLSANTHQVVQTQVVKHN